MPDPAYASDVAAPDVDDLRRELALANGRATSALNAGVPGRQPGEALRQFLAAEDEIAFVARQLRKRVRSEERWSF